MKTLTKMLLVALLVVGLTNMAMAATGTDDDVVTIAVNEIAVLNATQATLTMTILAPAVGGDLPADVTDNACYLQYTSNGTGAETSRAIDAVIDSNTPDTFDFKVLAGTPTGGEGTKGTPTAVKTLNNVAQDIITGIKDCHTGTGGTDGSQITYTITSLTMPAKNEAGTAYTVTFTLKAVS